jgi:hypothetical protein
MFHGEVGILTWGLAGTQSDSEPSAKQRRFLPL